MAKKSGYQYQIDKTKRLERTVYQWLWVNVKKPFGNGQEEVNWLLYR